MGNDRIWQNTLPSRWKFQSTFPRGERLYTDMQKLIMFNFNPRSLVGNDGVPHEKLSDFKISIHVPSWGTTTVRQLPLPASPISIHVPSWGTTTFSVRMQELSEFQSTFPRGERPKLEMDVILSSSISIHVPSWGTTPVCLCSPNHPRYFNPRSLVGNDMQQLILANWDKLFQSTFPRGERQMTKGKKMDPSVISIHVPSWGTTTAPSNGMPWLIFQSTFPRGERRQIFTNILCFFMQ